MEYCSDLKESPVSRLRGGSPRVLARGCERERRCETFGRGWPRCEFVGLRSPSELKPKVKSRKTPVTLGVLRLLFSLCGSGVGRSGRVIQRHRSVRTISLLILEALGRRPPRTLDWP